MTVPALQAAISYTARGWPVFPVNASKRPLTAHGLRDATLDSDQLRSWWSRYPDAVPSIATGGQCGIVAVDIDVRPDLNGFDSLDDLDVVTHPKTPTAHTPSGGMHMLFMHPGAGHFVKTIAGKIGPGIDVRGDGGSLTLPPGPGRRWDPLLDLSMPLAPMPEWAKIKEPEPQRVQRQRPQSNIAFSRYGEAALDAAVKRIATSPTGEQEMTLNREVFGIGRLAGGGEIPPGVALDSLVWAAQQMPSTDRHRPWQPVDLKRKVETSFAAGLRQPRTVNHDRA